MSSLYPTPKGIQLQLWPMYIQRAFHIAFRRRAGVLPATEVHGLARTHQYSHWSAPELGHSQISIAHINLLGLIPPSLLPLWDLWDSVQGIIASISQENPAFVTCVDDERLEFQDGELITFGEIKGMSELNGVQVRRRVGPSHMHTRAHLCAVGVAPFKPGRRPGTWSWVGSLPIWKSPTQMVDTRSIPI